MNISYTPFSLNKFKKSCECPKNNIKLQLNKKHNDYQDIIV